MGIDIPRTVALVLAESSKPAIFLTKNVRALFQGFLANLSVVYKRHTVPIVCFFFFVITSDLLR